MAYIKENVTLSSSITLTNDLYLCLNGFNLTGISFVNNSYTVYTTNCQEKDNSITVAENTYLANGEYIQILSNKNKIRVNTDKIINADNTVNKPGEFVFMNVDFRQVINGNVDGRIMNVLTANRKITLSTVSIVNYSIAEGYEMIALVGTNIKTEFYNVTIKGNTTPSRSLMKVGSEGETSRFEGCSFEENNSPNNAIISVRANTKLYMKQNYLYKNMANNLLHLLSADTQVILEDGNEIIENQTTGPNETAHLVYIANGGTIKIEGENKFIKNISTRVLIHTGAGTYINEGKVEIEENEGIVIIFGAGSKKKVVEK